MSLALLSRSKQRVRAPARRAKGRWRYPTPVGVSAPGFIGSAPRLGAGASGHPPEIRTKLKVSAPNERLEQEADRAAEQVMRMPGPPIATVSGPLGIQRLCAECEDEVQRERAEDDERAQVEPAAGSAPVVTPQVTAEIVALRGCGRPLPASERAFFEPRFGQNFSHVRIHADAMAASLAEALSAQAFTLGHHVFFAAARYAPATTPGRRLLAHELSHVLQQGDVPPQAISRQEAPDEEEEFGEPSVLEEEEGELEENGEEPGAEPPEQPDSDPCNQKLTKLEPLYDYEECEALIETTHAYQDVAGRSTDIEKNIENVTTTKNRLVQEKEMIEKTLPQEQELHDARLVPLLARRDELLLQERITYDRYHRADTALQEALDRYWARFGELVTENDKAMLIREAISAERKEPSTTFERVVLLVEKSVTALAYLAQLAKVEKLMADFEEEWTAWADELEILKKAEEDALDAYEPIDQALTAVSNQINDLEANDPTRKHNQVKAQIAVADQQLQGLIGQYEQDAKEAGEIVKRKEAEKNKCAEAYGTDAWALFRVLEDYVASCQ
jgi:Domain of unknown function (DUF4157)